MQEKLDRLYHMFYHSGSQTSLETEVKTLHHELIQTLSKSDRKKVLKIIDRLTLITLLQSKDSFVSGFQLATELQIELQFYKQGGFVSETTELHPSFDIDMKINE
ncbi:hypothetical protein [Chakrabartyella piscis]|uniref:hypothetical protein n=1 Tax=Chakrabartyella piscis TaxID=2918914 RepID=UPI00295889EB|nr:hypothetical protein [Chakrabartyella piscis]